MAAGALDTARSVIQGRSQDFSKGGGVTLGQTISSWRFCHGIL